MKAKKIFLFDLDGVLLIPGGYDTALIETFRHFYQKMGIEDQAPDETAGETFESFAVTNDWDMLSIGLAITFDCLLQSQPAETLPEGLEAACAWVRERQLRLPAAFDMVKEIQKLGPYYWKRQIPSQSILEMALQPAGDAILVELKQHALLFDLLGRTREILTCKPIRHFQNLVLGDREFYNVYGEKADFAADSYLLTYDRLALSSAVWGELTDALRSDRVRAAAITARPSWPPRECVEKTWGYPPEAEFAGRIIGISELPLIGCGRLQYLGEMLRQPDGFDAFVKPAGTHALVGIGAAWGGSELAALKLAGVHYQEQSGRNMDAPLFLDGLTWDRFPRVMDVHVFEDSPGGLRSAQTACGWLQQRGIQTRLSMYGVAVNPNKVAALQRQGAVVYSDVNDAVLAALAA